MRVLLVNHVAALGGAERSLLDLAGTLVAEHDHEIILACPQGPLAEASIGGGAIHQAIPAVRLRRPSWRHPLRPTGAARLPAARQILRRIVSDTAPDCIHANSLTAMLMLGGIRTSPLIWHVRDLALHPGVARRAAARARAIVAISPTVERHLNSVLPQSLQARITCIMNGIPIPDSAAFPPRHEARRSLGLPPEVPLVGMLAHMTPWKRHDRMIELATRLAPTYPQARFVIAGGDLFGEHAAYLHSLHNLAAQNGVADRVIFMGATDTPLLLLRALDVLAHPAADEPFGRVICEAMAVGTPVVALNRGGPADILRHGETGWLADVDAPASLAEGVARLLDDEALRTRLSANAADAVRRDFDIRTTAAALARLWEAAACQPGRVVKAT